MGRRGSNHERRERPSAAFGRNQEEGKKIKGQKHRHSRERRANSRTFIFLPQMFLPIRRSPKRRIMPTDGVAIPRIKKSPSRPVMCYVQPVVIRGIATPSVGASCLALRTTTTLFETHSPDLNGAPLRRRENLRGTRRKK